MDMSSHQRGEGCCQLSFGTFRRKDRMLEIRCHCECCDKALPPEAADAMICSFECTFCAECVTQKLRGICPNCGGNFVSRPIRPPHLLEKYPASTTHEELVVGDYAD